MKNAICTPKINIPGGYFEVICPNYDNYSWTMITSLEKNRCIPEHIHHFTSTFIQCVEGEGQVTVNGENLIILKKGVGFFVPRETLITVRASISQPLRLLSMNSGFTPLSGNINSHIDFHFSDERVDKKWHPIFQELRTKCLKFKNELKNMEISIFKTN